MEYQMVNGKLKMKEICPGTQCTACMACYSVCPVHAISIVQDGQGFYRPQIDLEKCVGCKRCAGVCPINGVISKNQPRRTVAAWARDATVHKESSSGGAFTAFAKNTLEAGGVVFGVVYDKDWRVIHTYTETLEGLAAMRGSKYVQSDIGNSFREAKRFLESGRDVFFTGTPCQINGLKNFLGKDYPNLLTADVVCHGPGSPLIFQNYLEAMEKRAGAEIQSFRMRYKTETRKRYISHFYNNKIIFKNNFVIIKDADNDPYLVGFFENYLLNPGCYECRFATPERPGDISFADFWGYRADSFKMLDKGDGISLLLLNSEKAEAAFEKIRGSLQWCEKPLSEAVEGNPHLRGSCHRAERYDEFWKDYRAHGYDYVEQKYFQPLPPEKESVSVRVKGLVPVEVKYLVKKYVLRK